MPTFTQGENALNNIRHALYRTLPGCDRGDQYSFAKREYEEESRSLTRITGSLPLVPGYLTLEMVVADITNTIVPGDEDATAISGRITSVEDGSEVALFEVPYKAFDKVSESAPVNRAKSDPVVEEYLVPAITKSLEHLTRDLPCEVRVLAKYADKYQRIAQIRGIHFRMEGDPDTSATSWRFATINRPPRWLSDRPPRDGELAYGVDSGNHVTLYRVVYQDNFDGGIGGRRCVSLLPLGAPVWTSNGLCIPEEDPPASSAKVPPYGDCIMPRSEAADRMAESIASLRKERASLRAENKIIKESLARGVRQSMDAAFADPKLQASLSKHVQAMIGTSIDKHLQAGIDKHFKGAAERLRSQAADMDAAAQRVMATSKEVENNLTGLANRIRKGVDRLRDSMGIESIDDLF